MDELIQAYINYLKVEKDLKWESIRAQRRVLGFFCDYAYKKEILSIENISSSFVREFILKFGDTINKRYSQLSILRSFGRFAERQGQKNNLTFLELPTIPTKIGEVLTEQEVELMLNRTKTHKDWQARAIIAVLYGSGIRSGALLGLKNKNVDIEATRLHIERDKGGKEHYSLSGKKSMRAKISSL